MADSDSLTVCVGCVQRVGRRRRGLAVLTASVVVLAVMVLAAVVAIALDAVWRLSIGWRVLLLLAWLGLAYLAVVRFWRPASRGLSRDAIVVLLEKTFPGLAGRLATAVQLADGKRRAADGVSDGLYHAVAQQAEHACAALDATAAAPARPYVRRWLVALGMIVVAALWPGLAGGETAWTGFKRLFAPWSGAQWRTRTSILLAEDNVLTVRRGGTLVLNGQVQGQVPEEGTARVWLAGERGAAYRSRFAIGENARFRVRYRPVTTDLEVQLKIGDAQTERLSVTMVPPPEIKSLKLACTFPEYTGLGRQEYPDGNLQAIYQTDVRISLVATKPLARAVLAWQDEAGEPGEAQQMRLGAGNIATARFAVEKNAAYQVHLTDELGFGNDDPATYKIEMVDNEYPRIKEVRPERAKDVTAEATLPIIAELADDFALESTWLHYRVRLPSRGGATGTRAVTTVPSAGAAVSETVAEPMELPMPKGAKQATVTYLWPMESFALAEGSEVQYWIEVRDQGAHAKSADWPRCKPRRLRIVNPAVLTRQLNQRVEDILSRLTQVEQLQSESADAVSGAARSLDQTGRPEVPLEIARAEKWRQERISRRTAELAELLEEVTDDYLISRIGKPARVAGLRRASELLRRLAAEPMPQAVLLLDQAIAALKDLQLGAAES